MKKVYIYEMPPTVWFFPFRTIKQTIEDILTSDTDDVDEGNLCHDIFNTIEIAKEYFQKYTCWEGDGQVYISGLPNNDGGSFPLILIIIKQSNDGTTFLYSPVELPYLEEYLVEM